MHGEDMWRARRHLDANHCSDAAVGQKNPRCCPPQRRNIPSLHYEQTTVVSVIKNGWMLRKMVGFVKMKCRRDEVSIVVWLHCGLFVWMYPRTSLLYLDVVQPLLYPFWSWLISSRTLLFNLFAWPWTLTYRTALF